mgnify:CR=1 FL=1
MKKNLASLTLLIILASCSNTPDMETGEIRALQVLKMAFDKSKILIICHNEIDMKIRISITKIDVINSLKY